MNKKSIIYSIIILISIIILFGIYFSNETNNDKENTQNNFEKEKITQDIEKKNNNNNNKMLLILSAPSIDNEYYEKYFQEIVNYQINYAKKVLETNNDEIIILVDKQTKKYYSQLPQEILIEEEMYDIWMRDFTTINPQNPVQFKYTTASMNKQESIQTQKIFNDFSEKYNLNFKKTNYILDGGNIVDNYNGKAITTTRFLEDNNLEYEEAKKVLKDLLNVNQVAIIEPDDEILAHSDGMVAFIDDNVIAVNDYSNLDLEFHNLILEELKYSFPDTKLILVPVEFDEEGGVDKTKNIGSACGVNLNLVATHTTLYIPTFGNEIEKEVLEIIKNNTKKQIVEINAKNICLFGGSVRCTTWQIEGENMKKLLE